MGGELFGVLNTRCMNPDLIAPNSSGFYSADIDYIGFRVPNCILQMTWIIGIIGIIGCSLIWKLIEYNTRNDIRTHRINSAVDL